MYDIRRAQASDADAIGRLYSELNTLSKPQVSPAQIAAIARSENTYLLVCDDNGEVVATALVCLCQDVMFGNQPFAVVENIVVSTGCQRRGIGKRLMSHIEDLCLQQDCSKIMLQSNSKNRIAQDFYIAMHYDSNAKIGFVKYRRHFAQ